MIPDGDGNHESGYPIAPLEPLAVDAQQAAKLLGLSRSMFYKMAEAGRIGPQGVQLGKCKRYSLAELRAWTAAGMPRRELWEQMKDPNDE